MIGPDELAAMQAAAALAMPDTAQIYRPGWVANSMGGQTDTETLVGSAACRVDAAGWSPAVELYAARIGERQPFILNLVANCGVLENDRVLVNGASYRVLAVLTGSWEITAQVLGVVLT